MKRLQKYLDRIDEKNNLYEILFYRNSDEIIGLLENIFKNNQIISLNILTKDFPPILPIYSLQRIVLKIKYKCKECGSVNRINFPLSVYKYKQENFKINCKWCETEIE
jgi:hypothetical protein